MNLFRNKYRVNPARLKDRDYSSPGFYFVTICARGRERIFGEITEGEMFLNQYGEIIKQEWEQSYKLRRELCRDEFCIMPNHIHAIVRIGPIDSDPIGGDVARNVSTSKNPTMASISPKPRSLSTLIRAFKSAATNRMHDAGFIGNVWQPRFYDHVIRNERELSAIRQYVMNNPAEWGNDYNVVETSEEETGKQPWFVYLP